MSAADPTPVRVVPATQTISAGDRVVVRVNCTPQQPVKAFELKLSFNPGLLQATAVAEGNLFTGYTTFFNPGVIDNVAGTIINVYNLIVGPGNVSSAGSLIIINFTAKSTSGTSSLTLYNVRLTNESGYLPITVSSGSVTVTGGSSPPVPPPEEPPVTPPPSGSGNKAPSKPLLPEGPTLAEVGTSYSYSSAAADPEGDLVRLRFDWGDGSLSAWSGFVASNTSVSASHAWTNVSTYAVRVIAQDESGANSSWSETLTVMISQMEPVGLPPVGEFRLPTNASTNSKVVFDASESFDPDGTIVSYHWDFGDGATAVGAVVSHTYASPGEYTVTLTVTDAAGMTSTFTQVVRVAAASEAPLDDQAAFLSPNSILFLLAAVAFSVLTALLYYRYRVRGRYVPLQRMQPRGKTTAVPSDTTDINQIVDTLFREMEHRKQTPSTDSILDAYNNLIMSLVESNRASKLPRLNITQVEELVDRRIYSMIAHKVDQM